MPCSVEGCPNRSRNLGPGLCDKHYQRTRVHGDPLIGARPVISADERFDAKVDRSDPNGCHPWTAAVNRRGYGVFHVSEEQQWITAHRYAYIRVHGPLPPHVFVCHRCDNPPCCNLDHLFAGTNEVNSADRTTKGRSRRGEQHGRSRLTDAQREEIRRRYRAGGVSQQALADEFGIDQTAVSYVVRH